MNGTYILLLKLEKAQNISVGRSGVRYFYKGSYAYVGSALNGLEKRVSRHLNSTKKHFWHIDYLVDKAPVYAIILIPGREKIECKIAEFLNRELACIFRFGSSDCRCPGHLFHAAKRDDLDKVIMRVLTGPGLGYTRHSIDTCCT